MAAVPAIAVRDLAKSYARGAEVVHALEGVSFEIAAGEFAAITGPSGSGKSTLLHLVGALDRPSSGSVFIHGEEISGRPERELRGLRGGRIGFVFQQFYLLPGLTVAENVRLPLLFSRGRADEGRVREILASVGLAHRGGHLPSQLSGGEMQRVAVGRALVGNPEIILADEPTANLDSENGLAVFGLLGGLAARGITVVIVTHNPELAARTGRVIRLHDGRLASA
jgi:ABC-type lipoprotein export system ATPase subunit